MFALSRYGGLRCPSEHLALTWADVDWARNRITVHSPKTEHLTGHATRQIPLFPELEAYLLAVYDPDNESEYVITRYRDTNANLRTQLRRIIRKAGLDPWPKLFQNLRSTRETELAERWPEHVVCAWLGNSRLVARKHYLQVTDGHCEQAAKAAPDPAEKAMQNPVQTTVVSPYSDANLASREIGKPTPDKDLRDDAIPLKTGDCAEKESNLQPAD